MVINVKVGIDVKYSVDYREDINSIFYLIIDFVFEKGIEIGVDCYGKVFFVIYEGKKEVNYCVYDLFVNILVD